MPLTKKQKKLLLAGGLITVGGITAYTVAKALAKPPTAPAPAPTPPPPEVPPPTYPPSEIKFIEYKTTIAQPYGFHYEMATPVHPQYLRVYPLLSFEGPPWTVGYVSVIIRAKVVDALKRGVPNQTLLFWASATRDDQTGLFLIKEKEADYYHPVEVVTDRNGEAVVWVSYRLTDPKVKPLEDKLRFGCCTPLGWLWDIDVGDYCYPMAYNYICYKVKEAQTPPRVYVLYATLKGTTLENGLPISCYAVGRALW